MKIIEENHKYEYGCIMGILDNVASDLVMELNNKLIPNECLYNEPGEEYGREQEPHITIKFGLTKNYPKETIGKVISYIKPFSAWLMKINQFQNENFDVVKIDVKSDELMRWNKIFSKLPNEDKHPIYHPHLTLAYVLPGTGKNFIKYFKPVQVNINRIKYSNPAAKYYYEL